MLRFIIAIIAAVLVIVFMAQNTETSQITFLFWTITMSRAVMYFLIFLVGFGLGGVTFGLKKSRKREKK